VKGPARARTITTQRQATPGRAAETQACSRAALSSTVHQLSATQLPTSAQRENTKEDPNGSRAHTSNEARTDNIECSRRRSTRQSSRQATRTRPAANVMPCGQTRTRLQIYAHMKQIVPADRYARHPLRRPATSYAVTARVHACRACRVVMKTVTR